MLNLELPSATCRKSISFGFAPKFLRKIGCYELSVNEARFGLSRVLRVLSSFDPKTVEVLEVGAGILYPTGLSGEQAAARYGR